LKDPWSDHTKQQKLLDIIVITICAVLRGADDFPSVEQYGNAKNVTLRASPAPGGPSRSDDQFKLPDSTTPSSRATAYPSSFSC
jgi:hypothetical protein